MATFVSLDSFEVTEYDAVRRVRAAVKDRMRELGHDDLIDDAELVLSELVTNALLHAGRGATVAVRPVEGGVRLEVADRSRASPVLGRASDRAMTGRGLTLVQTLAVQWGVEATDWGKTVWAELASRPETSARARPAPSWDLPAAHAARQDAARYTVSLGEVPTDLLIDAKSHVDNLLREFALASAGERSGVTGAMPERLAELTDAVVNRFAEARQSIKRQALAAAHAGEAHTRLTLELPLDAADAAEEYLAALDEVDGYCRAMRLLTLETPPQHKVFRHWYIGELVAQLRIAGAGGIPPPPQPFEQRLLRELTRVAQAQRASDQAARLFTVAEALTSAATPEAVAQALLNEGVLALGASGAALFLDTDAEQLTVPGTVGYEADLVERLRAEPRDAALPAAVALRTGEAVWIESRQDRDARFPELAGFESVTVAMCAVPLTAGGHRMGALRFSFNEPRLFGEDDRRFVMALAALAAQALERAQLYHDRAEISRRVQEGLLPPELPQVRGLDVAAVYHPLGRAVEVGGDFYDMWPAGPDRWCIAIGDVAGTGPEAAAVSAQVRYSLRALTLDGEGPAQVLAQLNTVVRQRASQHRDDEVFCTAILGVVTLAEGEGLRAELAAGGHPFPLLRTPDGTVREVPVPGPMLGAFPTIEVEPVDVPLPPGSLLVLFTDGVFESRRDGRFFDIHGIAEVVAVDHADAAATARAIELAVVAHTGGVLQDDIAVLVLRVTA